MNYETAKNSGKPFRRKLWDLPNRDPNYTEEKWLWLIFNEQYQDVEYLEGSTWGDLTEEDLLALDWEIKE